MRSSRQIWTGSVFATALAWAADLVILALGNLGADVRVVTGWNPDGADLSVAEVVVTAAAAVWLGAALLAVLQRRPNAWRRWTVAVAAAAVLSAVPLLRLDVDTQSKVALVTMHLATGAAAYAGQTITNIRSHSVATA